MSPYTNVNTHHCQICGLPQPEAYPTLDSHFLLSFRKVHSPIYLFLENIFLPFLAQNS